jgi:hypothetical protein
VEPGATDATVGPRPCSPNGNHDQKARPADQGATPAIPVKDPGWHPRQLQKSLRHNRCRPPTATSTTLTQTLTPVRILDDGRVPGRPRNPPERVTHLTFGLPVQIKTLVLAVTTNPAAHQTPA